MNKGESSRLINQELAGTTDINGVQRDVLGFPIFKEGDKVFEGKLDESFYISNDTVQFKESTRQLKKAIEKGEIDSNIFSSKQLEQIRKGKKKIDGYIWHHNQVTGRMELVNRTAHESARHTGGKALWGGGKANR